MRFPSFSCQITCVCCLCPLSEFLPVSLVFYHFLKFFFLVHLVFIFLSQLALSVFVACLFSDWKQHVIKTCFLFLQPACWVSCIWVLLWTEHNTISILLKLLTKLLKVMQWGNAVLTFWTELPHNCNTGKDKYRLNAVMNYTIQASFKVLLIDFCIIKEEMETKVAWNGDPPSCMEPYYCFFFIFQIIF